MVFVFVPPGGVPTPYVLVAPPGVYFSPIEGIKPAPPELIREVLAQFGKDLTVQNLLRPASLLTINQEQRFENREPFVQSLTGSTTNTVDQPPSTTPTTPSPQ
jgi:hypothetical protein